MLTYQAIVAVRYPELVLHKPNHIYIGHFVPLEDVVAFCTYLKNYYRNLQQGATSQLLVLCNRTAVHNLLLQHGFQSTWYGGLRVSTTSSVARATARIAVIVQTGCGFLSGKRVCKCVQHPHIMTSLSLSLPNFSKETAGFSIV